MRVFKSWPVRYCFLVQEEFAAPATAECYRLVCLVLGLEANIVEGYQLLAC